MKGNDLLLVSVGFAVVLGVGFFALRPSSVRSRGRDGAGPESSGGGGSGDASLNIGGAKGFSLRLPGKTAERLIGVAAGAF